MKMSGESTLVTRLLGLAAWVGLAYGIFEGLESFLLSLLPQGLSWQNGNSVNALMFMPAFYLVAYLILGLLLIPFALLFRRVQWDFVLLFLLTALSGFLAAMNQGAVFSQTASALLGLGIGTVAIRAYRKRRERWGVAFIRGFPALAALALTVVGGTYAATRFYESRRLAALPGPMAGAPNVLLIVLDTQRADHLSSYGYHRPTTPHLDSLAAEGMLFEQAFAASSWTLPSHASLFTGRMVHEHLAGDGKRRFLGPERLTLAEALSGHGYATGGFVANTFWASRTSGLSRGFIRYEDFYGTFGDAVQRTTLVREFGTVREWFGAVDITGRKRAVNVNEAFLTWVDRLKGRPFFAFLNYMDVHSPYLPQRYAGRFGTIRPEFEADHLDIGNESQFRPSAELVAYWNDRYDECLLELDERIGALLAQLRDRGVLDHTIVIVTADHGEHFGEHGGILHHGASLYTQEIRVPLILRYPARIEAGVRASHPVSTTNLPATITDLAQLSGSAFPGRSLVAAPDSGESTVVPVLSEMGKKGGKDPPEWPASKGWVKSLVVDQWHLILLQDGTAELFNISSDISERQDLAASPEGAVVVGRLVGKLQGILSTSAAGGPEPLAKVDPLTRP